MKARSGALLAAIMVACIAHTWAAVLPDACGDDRITFDVKTQKGVPAPAVPDAGRAQIVFIENFSQNQGFCVGCEVTTRVGLDGAWVGANHGNSYFTYAVAPGQHHVCVDWQSTLSRLRQKVGLASLNAEAGKVYYYEIKVRIRQYQTTVDYDLGLAPLSDDEARYLVKIDALATATAKQ